MTRLWVAAFLALAGLPRPGLLSSGAMPSMASWLSAAAQSITVPLTTTSAPASAPSPTAGPKRVDVILGRTEKGVKVLAYVVGALWVYFNFLKGRTYRPRLEPRLEGSILKVGEAAWAVLTLCVQNVGLSKVSIQMRGSALRVQVRDLRRGESEWVWLATVAVLEAHQWIEPGESVEESQLFNLETAEAAVHAELILQGLKSTWKTSVIVTAQSGRWRADQKGG